MGLYNFGKEERIRRRADFLRISRDGAKHQTRHFRLSMCPNSLPHRRLGITVGKHVGTAVKRNRVKRLLREFFRRHKACLPAGDIIIMAKKGAAELGYHQVEEELGRLLLARARI